MSLLAICPALPLVWLPILLFFLSPLSTPLLFLSLKPLVLWPSLLILTNFVGMVLAAHFTNQALIAIFALVANAKATKTEQSFLL